MTGYISADDCRLSDLIDLVSQKTSLDEYPHAQAVEENVLIYDGARLRAALSRAAERPRVEAELARALSAGPGIVMLARAFADSWVVDRATRQFEAIIAAQRAAGRATGDHFAAAGQNDRIWNALEKLALRAPEVFADYYANDLVAAACRAWLGPGYQVTSQVNVVNPGGAAQVGHRDYHLGFLTPGQIERYPGHVHRLSPVLTLQGAVAHSDMPVATGPTCYLPHSQKYAAGYLATERPEFRAYFAEHHIQPALRLGDAAFFNPAVIHGAGTNRTADVRRMADVLQISSAFGRAMEAVDREVVCNAIYPTLLARAAHDPARTARAVAASAEGYPFPTNLDSDPPLDGLAPPSQADLVHRALAERWTPDRLRGALAEQTARRIAR